MRSDQRLSRTLHVLLHLADHDGPIPSQRLAEMLGTHSAVVRRTMGGLRDAGIVHSARGHGGGWTLLKPLTDITLLAIYDALDAPQLFAVGSTNPDATCLLERAANGAVDDALGAARATFRAQLASTTVADLADVRRVRMRAMGLDPDAHHPSGG